jgi:hypothetical protein
MPYYESAKQHGINVEENNWKTCLQNPLNMFDLKFCAVKLELPLGAIK